MQTTSTSHVVRRRSISSLVPRACVASLLLAVLSATALAAPSVPSLDGLEDALFQRIRAIEVQGATTSALQEELEALGVALSTLAQYTGSLDSYGTLVAQGHASVFDEDMQALVEVAGAVAASDTPDQFVRRQVTWVRDTLDDFREEARQFALADKLFVTDAEFVALIDDQLAMGDALRDEAFWFWPLDFGNGAELLEDAWFAHHQAHLAAEELKLLEALANPNDLVPYDPVVDNAFPEMSEPFTVHAPVHLDAPAQQLTVFVRLVRDMTDDPAFPGSGDGPPQVLLAAETLFDVPAGDVSIPVEVAVPPFVDERQHTRSGAVTELSRLGSACDIDGDLAIVASTPPSGSSGYHWVTVHARDEGGFNMWGEVAQLTPGTQVAWDASGFGSTLAIDGETVVVGAPGEGVTGAAYVFERQVDGSWPITATLTPDPAAGYGDGSRFGTAVDVSGDRIVVGAPHADYDDPWPMPELGRALIFERGAGGESWSQTADLVGHLSQDPVFQGLESRYGSLVAIDGDQLAVGSRGSVEMFEADDGQWSGPDNLGAFPGDTMDGTPTSVDMARDAQGRTVVVVGVPDHNFIVSPEGVGEVQVFASSGSDPGVAPFVPVTTVTAPSRMMGDRFGQSVSLDSSATRLIAGAPGHDHYGVMVDAGSVYVFVDGLTPGCPPIPVEGDWGLLARRTSEDPAPNTGFGRAVALDGETWFVGEPDRVGELGERGALAVFRGMEPIPPGTYHVLVEVDPHNAIVEFGDQEVADNAALSDTQVEVCTMALDQPNLWVESLQLTPVDYNAGGAGYIAVDKNGKQLLPAGVNLSVRMAGQFDGPLAGARVRVWGVIEGGTTVHAEFWDSTTSGYDLQSLALPIMRTGDTVHLSGDVRFPNAPGGSMTVNHDFEVFAEVFTPSTITDVDPSDDVLSLSGQDYTILVFNDCSFTQSFSKEIGNSEFNVDVGFMGSLAGPTALGTLPEHLAFPGSQSEYGAIGALSGGAGLTLFGDDVGELVRFQTVVERDPIFEYDSSYPPSLQADDGYSFVGVDLLFKNPFSGHLDTLLSLGADSVDLYTVPPPAWPEQVELCGTGVKLTLDAWSKEKKVEKEKTFFVAGVPVTVSGAAQGKVGVDVSFEMSDALVFTVAPNVDLSTALSMEIGNCYVLCVGAEGELVLVNDTFSVISSLGLTVNESDGSGGGLAGTSIGGLASFVVQNEISMLSGELSVFAIFPWVKWCMVEAPWPFEFEIPIPCGIYFQKIEHTIVEWAGLLNITQELVNLTAGEKASCCVQVDGTINCQFETVDTCDSWEPWDGQ